MKDLMKKIDWSKSEGLVPAIIQDDSTGTVLMLGYMNRQSLVKTLKTKKVWFYSRSKRRLWQKGEISGNILNLVDIKRDCDDDALLVKTKPVGPVCHTGNYSCFNEDKKIDELLELFQTIQDRKKTMPKNSYTASLFKGGLNKIALKVIEEATEVVQAARKETRKRLIEETVDAIYHLLVLLSEKNIKWGEITKEIGKRKKRRV